MEERTCDSRWRNCTLEVNFITVSKITRCVVCKCPNQQIQFFVYNYLAFLKYKYVFNITPPQGEFDSSLRR